MLFGRGNGDVALQATLNNLSNNTGNKKSRPGLL